MEQIGRARKAAKDGSATGHATVAVVAAISGVARVEGTPLRGGVARRTGVAENGHNAVGIIRALRWIESIPMDQSLAHEATQIAGSRRLRGADAVYVALAVMRRVPLITLDAEMLERARGVADVFTPEQWLQKR